MSSRRLKYITFLILSLLVVNFAGVSFTYLSGNFPEKLSTAFNNGSYKTISNYFNDNIELDILGQEGIYGKLQAEQILKAFFSKNKPTNFEILHEGGKSSALYAIGKLQTNNGNYRINFLFKSNIILQIRIEADNGN